MQVKCKFQLTSETEASESIHSNNERVRLSTSVDLDKNSTLIVMICSNENGNNHIVAYHVERRIQTTLISSDTNFTGFNKLDNEQNKPPARLQYLSLASQNLGTFTTNYNTNNNNSNSPRKTTSGLIAKKTRPRIIVKQIYYHGYNEDIEAICLSDTGNKLALISASSTIYVLPIKNILLNLHAKQLRSSQGKSMYFYDASIINCCTLENPVAIAYFESQEVDNKSIVVVANDHGELSFIDVENKKELNRTSINERVKYMRIVRDKFSFSLLITSESFRQFRYALELVKQQDIVQDLTQSPNNHKQIFTDEYVHLEKDVMPSWDRKPILIKLNSTSVTHSSGAAAAFHKAFIPSVRIGNQASLLAGLSTRDRPLPLVFYHPGSMISVVDILGPQKFQGGNGRAQTREPRLLRFFSNKQFYYRPQKPILVCRLTMLDPDEMITHVVLTDRFLAIATDRDRCIINSRNCCNLKNSNSSIESNPVVKEITFNSVEKILSLLKSPVSNDQDNVIDSFLLVTSRSIYSIEARQSCRDMFTNLIDNHLEIKSVNPRRTISESLMSSGLRFHDFAFINYTPPSPRNSEPNLMISNFLSHRDEIYERISYDSKAYSILFKLELNSLYEAYGDKLLLRNQFDLANRFFQMAKFDHTKIVSKYVRLGAFREAIQYITNAFGDESEILDEKERIDLSKIAFDCLLAKTLVERSKTSLYKSEFDRDKLKMLQDYADKKSLTNVNIVGWRSDVLTKQPNNSLLNRFDPYHLCEHTPHCQGAKLSATTIVVDDTEDDEATMTACLDNDRKLKETRLECEKFLINFVKEYMPPSLYEHVLTQLVDFNMIDLANCISRSLANSHSLLKILLKAKDENRIIFREGRFEGLLDKLCSNNYNDLIKIDSSNPSFLQFITSPEITKAMAKDINLACSYLGYQQLIQVRKYSFVAIRQLEFFKRLMDYQKATHQSDSNLENMAPTKIQKQSAQYIFNEFMNASLNESIEDSCRLWFNYINFYLNYIGTSDELEEDIFNLLESDSSDCRLAITLYKAIGKDENGAGNGFSTEVVSNTPLESMSKLYNLSNLFKNEFLMKLLDRSLELVSQTNDLDSLSKCLDMDSWLAQVTLPCEIYWSGIVKAIQEAVSSTSTSIGETYKFNGNAAR